MLLPGGLLLDGDAEGGSARRHRDFTFRPVSGRLEMLLAESSPESGSPPAQVTAVLAAALDLVAGGAATAERIRALPVADRQFLARRLDAELGGGEVWLSPLCARCGARFDVAVVPAEMPAKTAPEGYPWSEVETSLGRCRLRVPTGADQEALAERMARPEPGPGGGVEGARRFLAARCVVECSGTGRGLDAPALEAALTEADVDAVEAAVEAVCPELAVQVATSCPECGESQTVDVDPYLVLGPEREAIYREVDTLARAYGWSEADVLALPRRRRRIYLDLVDRSRGMVA